MSNQANGFEFEGVWITDPTMDETGRFQVDPLEYYGAELLSQLNN